MGFLDAVLLGLLEGATEFLPVSSTGHLILAQHLLGVVESPFTTSFLIAIQLGAIAAVIVSFWRSFLDLEVLKRLLTAFIPTAIIGFVLYKLIKGFLLGSELTVVIALLVGGILLIVFEYFHTERADGTDSLRAISYRQAFTIGLFQSIAVIPGVSRSGATIVGGLLLGMRRAAIVEFSFLLAVPTMLAATGYDLLKTYSTFETGDIGIMAVGIATAFVVAMLSLRFLLNFVKTRTFIPFGIYRILLALVFFAFVL
ncbi:MAG: undecaprenyl-diphosphatase [Candidatus Parcubacteria bacterium]|jgi:undecaprenyl-diphosphatase|nr:undecaprenyl-diphosphatase [Candidatus Parcubacteria bacterium]